MGTKYAADLLVEMLEKAGVARVYGITGDSANHITDAISRSSIRFIHTRHEEVAAFAAAAEAAATGRMAVCMGSCGPGSLHLVNGLYEAHRNGVPVLALATEIHKSQIGTRFIQEIDTREVFRGCSHFCEYARTVEQLPRLMGIAMQTAVSRRGVAVLIITAEVSSELIDRDMHAKYNPFYTHPVIKPSPEELTILADEIARAGRIAIFGGAGCNDGANEVKALASKIKAPVIWSYRAKEALDHDNPYPVGMAGLLGTSAGDYALHNCDLLLLLGCGFAFDTMYPDHARIIQVDLNGENLSRRHNVDLGFVGDIKATLSDLLPRLEEKLDDVFAQECVTRFHKAQQALLHLAHQNEDSTQTIYPEHLTEMVNRKAAENAWIAADVGTPWAFTGRYIESMGGRRFFTSSLHGTMAAAMPFSIGLSVTDPERQVIALCGDGGLSMLFGDLMTIRQEKLSPKIIIYNNSSLDFVSMEMKADGLLDSYTNLENPNFANVAQALGIKGIRVERVAELESALDEAFAFAGAVVVDVVVDGRSLLMPPSVTATMAGKYAHYVSKMIRDGRAEELLQEAVTNLRVGDNHFI